MLTEVAAHDAGLLNVKAELGLGKIHVARREYDEAIRQFFKVAYGHGGASAPAAYHRWQAEAVFAAATSLEATGRPEAAHKLYQELVDHYPQSERTAVVRRSLERSTRR